MCGGFRTSARRVRRARVATIPTTPTSTAPCAHGVAPTVHHEEDVRPDCTPCGGRTSFQGFRSEKASASREAAQTSSHLKSEPASPANVDLVNICAASAAAVELAFRLPLRIPVETAVSPDRSDNGPQYVAGGRRWRMGFSRAAVAFRSAP